VADSCEYGDEPSGSGATELVCSDTKAVVHATFNVTEHLAK
jgi:hypothetical protein